MKLLQLAGFAAERTPRSGANNEPENKGYDVKLPLFGKRYKVEVKHHGNSFIKLYHWLKPVDMLVVHANYKEPLVIMPLRTAIDLLAAAKIDALKGLVDKNDLERRPR